MAGLFCGYILIFIGCASLPQALRPDTLSERITAAQRQWLAGTGDSLIQAPISLEPSRSVNPQNILNRLIYASPIRGSSIDVLRTQDEIVNASTDGNRIYVTKGLSDKLGSDPALIGGILGHELGHIIANHVPRARTRLTLTDILSSVIQRSGDASDSTSVLVKGVLHEALHLGGAAYSRKDEKEADVIGTVLAKEAGFDPFAMMRFFDMIEEEQKSGFSPFAAQLLPQIAQYQAAVKQRDVYLKAYQKERSPELRAKAIQWSSLAMSHKQSMVSVLRSFRNEMLAAMPIYRTHPPSEERKEGIELVALWKTGKLSFEELAERAKLL